MATKKRHIPERNRVKGRRCLSCRWIHCVRWICRQACDCCEVHRASFVIKEAFFSRYISLIMTESRQWWLTSGIPRAGMGKVQPTRPENPARWGKKYKRLVLFYELWQKGRNVPLSTDIKAHCKTLHPSVAAPVPHFPAHCATSSSCTFYTFSSRGSKS